MDYFIMSMDSRLSYYAPKLLKESPDISYLVRERSVHFTNTRVVYVDDSRQVEYPDFLDGEVKLVSEKLMRVLGMYQRDAIFNTVQLIERKNNRHETYYQIEVPEIQCRLSIPNQDIRNRAEDLVIDQEIVGFARVFIVSFYGKRLVVRLDVAESILRRDSYAVCFNRVSVVTKEEI